jgi:prepilin-type processing-associated H-X9-DG protein
MKLCHQKRCSTAFTLIEVMVVIVVTAVIIGLIIPAMVRPQVRSKRIGCMNNMKQIGLAFRIFENDHDDSYPMNVAVTNGGSREFRESAEVFRHWLAVSNELVSPKILACPADRRRPAKSMATLGNSNISYFVGLDSSDVYPKTLLAGDRNLTTNGVPVGAGILVLATNLAVGWSEAMHGGSGNVLLGDGSVQVLSPKRLRLWAAESGAPSNRLAIP